LLHIKGYDVILGLDLLSQFATMLVNWEEKWVELAKPSNTVKLAIQEEIAKVQMCESIQVAKEVKEGSELMVAHIWLCQAESASMDLSSVPVALDLILLHYKHLFNTQTSLPPVREIDHRIPLVPDAKPINLRSYRYL
jgi:hypothetical protein